MRILRQSPNLSTPEGQVQALRTMRQAEFLKAMATGTIKEQPLKGKAVPATPDFKQWRFPKPTEMAPRKIHFDERKAPKVLNLQKVLSVLFAPASSSPDAHAKILATATTDTIRERLKELRKYAWEKRLAQWILAPAMMIEWASHQPPDTSLLTIIGTAGAIATGLTIANNIRLKQRTKGVVARTFHAAAKYLAEQYKENNDSKHYLSRMAQALLHLRAPKIQDLVIKLAQKEMKDRSLLTKGKEIVGTTLLSTASLYIAKFLFKYHILPKELAHSPISGHLKEFAIIAAIASLFFYVLERKATEDTVLPGKRRLEKYTDTFIRSLSKAIRQNKRTRQS